MNHSDISRENLKKFSIPGHFVLQTTGAADRGSRQTTSCRDDFTHLCPFQGFIDDGLPGCLVHPQVVGEEQRDKGLFGAIVCGRYLCPAYEILRNETKAILIENLDDWYLYTIAIIDPIATERMIDRLHEEGLHNGDESFKQALDSALKIHAKTLGSRRGNVFCYSREEYAFQCKSSPENLKREAGPPGSPVAVVITANINCDCINNCVQ